MSVRGLMGVSGVSGEEGIVVALMPVFMYLQLTDNICEQRKAGGVRRFAGRERDKLLPLLLHEAPLARFTRLSPRGP